MALFILINTVIAAGRKWIAGAVVDDVQHPADAIRAVGGFLVPTGTPEIDAASVLARAMHLSRGINEAASESLMTSAMLRVLQSVNSLAAYFGDGSDGDVTVSTPITLTRDMFYNNLTVVPGGSINTAGYKIYGKDTCDVSTGDVDAIHCNGAIGNNASATPGTTTPIPTATYATNFWTGYSITPVPAARAD